MRASAILQTATGYKNVAVERESLADAEAWLWKMFANPAFVFGETHGLAMATGLYGKYIDDKHD